MTAEQVFSLASGFAALGWLVLAAGVLTRRDALVSLWAGRVWPLALAALYTLLILFFFARAPGGFDSLAHVQALFSDPWAALAGWVHYLAFDLAIGAWIARQVMARSLPRLLLVVLLPLTFLFGPIGLLLYSLVSLATQPAQVRV